MKLYATSDKDPYVNIHVIIDIGFLEDDRIAASIYKKGDQEFTIPDGSLLPADKLTFIDPDSQLVEDYNSFLESLEDLIEDYYGFHIYYTNLSKDYSKYTGMLAKDDNGNIIVKFDFTLRISNHPAHRSEQSQKNKKDRKHKLEVQNQGKITKPIVKSVIVNEHTFSDYMEAYLEIDRLIESVSEIMHR